MDKPRILLLALVVPPLLTTISCGSRDASLDAKLKGLDSDDPEKRASAVYQLAAMKGKESTFVPRVIDAADDENEQVRLAAISVIGGFGGPLPVKDQKASEKLRALAVGDSSAEVRLESIAVLGRSYPEDEKTEDILVRALEDKDLDVATAAAQALLQLGTEKAAPASQKIAEVLKRVVLSEAKMGDEAPLTGQGLAMDLAKLGPEAVKAAPSLKSMLEASGVPDQTRKCIREALKAIEGGGGP